MPDDIRMTYREWLAKANGTSTNGEAEGVDVGPNDEHWYFRLIGCGYMGADGSCDAGSSEYLFDELPFFQPVDNLYLAQGDKQKGIHCRFGMKGVIAENHFDASRNAIVVLRGTRRYVLSHPNNCDKLTLLPQGHPSARHSAVDYTNPDLETFPEFAEATANEVVLQAGHVLYLPTSWFHFIVSLDLNMQCNTRSGVSHHYQQAIEQCGF
jgi:Cupin-like domain